MVDLTMIPTEILKGIIKERGESLGSNDSDLLAKLNSLPEDLKKNIREAKSINSMKPSIKSILLDYCIDFLLKFEKYLPSFKIYKLYHEIKYIYISFRPPTKADYKNCALSVCKAFPNLKDRVNINQKAKLVEDMWICSVRSVISNSYRCRKSRNSINLDISSPKEGLKNYQSLSASKKLILIKESLNERNTLRNSTEVSIFLEQWPFLMDQDGLRGEFKAMTGKKNLDYIVARLRRAFPSKKFIKLLLKKL